MLKKPFDFPNEGEIERMKRKIFDPWIDWL